MEKESKIRTGRYIIADLSVHLVFITKINDNIFTNTMLDDMRHIINDVCQDFKGQLIEFYGGDSYIRMKVTYPPKVAISTLINSLKCVSSRMMKKTHPCLKDKLLGEALWSPSYFASSSDSIPLEQIRQYIEQ